MPISNEVLVKFRADASDLIRNTQRILDQLRVINEVLSRAGAAAPLIRGFSDLGQVMADDSARAKQLQTTMEELERIRLRGETLASRRPSITPLQQVLTDLPARPSVAQVEERQREIAAELAEITQRRTRAEEANVAIAHQYEEIFRRIVGLATEKQFLDERSAQILSGDLAADIIAARTQELRRAIDQVQAAKTALESSALQQLGRAAGGRIEQGQIQALRELFRAKQEIDKLDRQIASAQARLNDEAIRGTAQQIALEQRLLTLEETRKNEIAALTRAERQSGFRTAQVEEVIDLTGVRKQYNELIALNAQLEQELVGVFQHGAAAAVPELESIKQRLAQNLAITERTEDVELERVQLLEQARRLQQEAPTRAIPRVPTPEELTGIANLPALERTLFTAFDDVGRRFRTALQFALSGAIIFAAQRLVREFFQAAIEVERTFADIESALEFDLAGEGFERGTAAFNKRVEEIRRAVLGLANDFNVLPAEANDAAFKMVARFQESENALKAIRAQFLATKISTIDQSEAIRALSATAEGFASAVLDANAPLTLQERLLERERIAADNYGKALDEAVLIQQRFGVEVEDVLEGTARAAQTFAQLGFSRQQTEATVSAVSRVLGQTGENVAERLNRAFGAITQPETRDKLLELAAASETLNLSLRDFDDGATLVRKLDAQFARLEQREPQTALQLRDIIGQRRETEVVAAFFGTADLRREIENSLTGAAGAAERRFSFLLETVSEKIQSIIAQFQSLAQNFERLQLFGPIKAFLTAIDGALAGVNALLKTLQNVAQFFDDIGASVGLKLGSSLKQVLVTMLSIYTILRATSAAIAVISTTRALGVAAQKGLQTAAGGGDAAAALSPVLAVLATRSRELGGGFKGLLVTTKTLGTGLAFATANLANWTGWLVRSIPGVIALQTKLGLSVTALGGWTFALVTAALLIGNFVKEGAKAVEFFRTFQEIPARAEIETRRQERITPFTSPEARAEFKAGQELDLAVQQAETNVRNLADTITTRLFPAFDKTTRDAVGLGNAIFRQVSVGFIPPLEEELIPGSKAWWEAQIKAAREAFQQAQLDAVRASIQELGASPAATGTNRELVSNLSRRTAEVAGLFAAAGDDPAKLAEAQLALDLLRADAEGVAQTLGLTYDTITQATRTMIGRIGELQRDLQLGRKPVSQAPEEFDKIADDLKARSAELAALSTAQTPEIQEEIRQTNEAADEAILLGMDARQKTFERERARLGLIEDPVRRTQAELRSYINELALVRERGFGGTDRELDLMDQIAVKQAELARVIREQAAKVSRHGVNMAKTLDEWVKAMRELNEALIKAIRFINIPVGPFGTVPIPDPSSWIEAIQAVEENNKAIEERLNQEAQIVAEARTRLAGPINNRVQQITAQINGLRVKISQGFFSPGEALQAQVQLQELIAQRIEAEAEAAAAWIRLQAGVGDSIRQTEAELTIVARQLEITAKLYGRQSAQYLQLKLSQENLRNQLISAQLELEDLNRRLETDLTDSFAQAQLDLVEILRQLSQLDLGPLEQARLELQKRQAEAAAEKAFFDDRLFQLRFDFETGDLGLSGYVANLRRLLDTVDTSTQQGKEIFLEISSLIESLTNDVTDFQFNIPSSIRLPTLFEVRRALAADQLGVTYQDNRTQSIELQISNNVDLQEVFRLLDQTFGDVTSTEFRRSATGGAGIAPTWFSS